MTLTDVSRKRPRSCDEEGCELMPISKRINNLHIRSTSASLPAVVNGSEHVNEVEGSSSHFHPGSTSFCDMHSNQFQATNCAMMDDNNSCESDAATASHGLPCTMSTHYAPELDNSENPHYYYINRVLFEAHVQRMLRLSSNRSSCQPSQGN